MVKYTNKKNISIGAAVWLLRDTYDYKSNPKYLSATTLLKPTRMIILSKRVNEPVDLSDLVASRMGSSIHDSIEQAWKSDKLVDMLGNIGFPKHVAERIVINPETVKEGDLPVYIEKRGYYQYGEYTIGGKFDICIDGALEDFKTTSVYSYIFDSRSDDYIKQGSIYRLIFKDIVDKDVIKINYIFKDFSANKAEKDPNYPPSAIYQEVYPLMSIEATKNMIHRKVDEIDKYMDVDEPDLPLCTDEELWLSEISYAYFKNKNSSRATKIYDNYTEAENRLRMDGGKGIIEKRGGEPVRCNYCPATSICSQFKRMLEK